VSGTYATLVDLIHTADHRIDQIVLYHGNLSQPYRMVDLGLGTVWQDCGESMKTDTLNSITEFDGSGTASLPAVTLSYVTLAHAWGTCYEYEHLQQVDNGYGGRVRFTYGAGDGRVSDGWQCNCVPEYGNTFVATQKETWDGLGVQPAVVEYAFAKPCYDQYDGDVGDLADAFNCPTRNDFSGYGHGGLVGFEVVTETVRGYQGETLSRQTTWFSQTRQTMGRPGLEKSFDASGSLLRSVQTRNVTATVGPTTFSYGSPVTTTDYGGGVSASHVVSYAYDSYGNVTAVYDYGGSTGGDERSVHYTYNPTTTLWIVNKLGRETVYEGIRTDDTTDANLAYRRSRTRYTYNGQACWTAPPLKGAVTAVDHWNGTSGGSPGDCWAANFSMVSRAGYDEWGNRISETGPRLYTTTMAYDGLYHLYPLQVCNALGQCRHTDYYGLGGIAADYGLPGQVKRTVDPNGAVTEYRYDAFGRLTAVKAPDDVGWSVQQATRYVEYQSMGQVGQQRIVAYSGRNATWQEEYLDGLGRTVQVHQNAGSGQEIRATTQYDGLGRAVAAWTPYTGTHGENGGYGAYGYVPPAGGLPRTSTEYDGLGRTVRVVNPDSTTVQSAYPGWTAVVTDANGHRLARTSDGLGRLVRVEEYTGTVGSSPLLYATTRYGYDVLDHLTAVTDTLGNLITTTYDTLGHKTAMRDPDVGTWQYRYDAAGNLIKQQDARKQAICFYYDALERPVGKTYHGNPLNFEAPGLCSGTYAVTYTYESGGSATYVSHGERIIHGGGGKAYVSVGSISTDTYFTLNVPVAGVHSLSIVLHQDTKVTNPGIYSSTVQVYLDGSSLGTINVSGGAGPAFQEYADWMVGSTSVGVFQVNVSAGAHTLRLKRTGGQGWEEIAQDGSGIVLDYSAGQRTAMGVPNVDTTAWRYDVRGRVVREVRTIAGGGTFTTSYAYDALDRAVATTYPDGEVVSTTYSAAGWPVQVRSATHSLNYAGGVTYNALGQVTALPLGNNLTTNYTYEARTFRLLRIQTGSLFDLRYGYDAVGNVTAITDTVAGNQVQAFGYDALDRLASARATGGSVLIYTHVYSYNAIGNMRVATGLGTYVYGATASGCATGTVSVKPHAVTQAGGNTYAYDCSGNVTRRVITETQMVTYYQEYDAENRLVAVTNTVTSLVTRFAYDGDGQRVKVTAGTTTTVYIGDYYEKQGTTVTKYYYLGGQRVAMRVGPAGQAGTVTYLQGDHLGSTSLATSSSGGVVARQRYYPYGAVRPGGTGTLPTDYTFTGQWSDGDIRLIHMGARWYDPQVGRWMSADTIVPDPANPQSFNRFSYVLGNPLRYSDPSGHVADAGGGAGLTIEDLIDIYDHLAEETDPEAWHGHLQEYFAAKAALYRYLADEAPQLVIETAATHVADTHRRLIINGFYGQRIGLAEAYLAGGGEAGVAIPLMAGTMALIRNPFGMKGNPDHQATVRRLVQMAEDEFEGQDVEIRKSRSIAERLGVERRPDVSVVDNQTRQLLKVYEAARIDMSGNFVPREQQKMFEYWEVGIRYWFEEVE